MHLNAMEYTKRDCDPREIAKPRNFTLNLSDSDVEVLCGKAAILGMTAEDLLSRFASDLVFGSICTCEQDSTNATTWYKNHSLNESSEGKAYCENSFIHYLFRFCVLPHCAYIMEDISCSISELSFLDDDSEHNQSVVDDLEASESFILHYYDNYAKSVESPQTLLEAITDLIKYTVRLSKLLGHESEFSY